MLDEEEQPTCACVEQYERTRDETGQKSSCYIVLIPKLLRLSRSPKPRSNKAVINPLLALASLREYSNHAGNEVCKLDTTKTGR